MVYLQENGTERQLKDGMVGAAVNAERQINDGISALTPLYLDISVASGASQKKIRRF